MAINHSVVDSSLVSLERNDFSFEFTCIDCRLYRLVVLNFNE